MTDKQIYWIGGGLLAATVAFFGGRAIVKNARARRMIKSYDQGAYDVTTGKKVKPGSDSVAKINLSSIATSIGTDLGIAYGPLDPRRWTENDDAVERALLKVPKPLFPELVKIYYDQYKRDLIGDLNSMLDTSNLGRVQYLWS